MKRFKKVFLTAAAALAVFVGFSATAITSKADSSANTIADVSQFQGNINWQQAAGSLKYVIIRVQHGTRGYKDYQLDNKHNDSAVNADRFGIPYGEYSLHAFSSKKEARSAALNFLRHSNKNARFYALDNEWQKGRKHKNQSPYVKVWRQTMRKYTKRPLIYYASESFANSTNHSGFDGTWIANYSASPRTGADLWQKGQSRIPGFGAPVDTDVIVQNGATTVANWFSNEQLDKPTNKPKTPKRHKQARRHFVRKSHRR